MYGQNKRTMYGGFRPPIISEATQVGSEKEHMGKIVEAGQGTSTPVSLPNHLFNPEGSQSLDIRHVQNIDPGIMNYTILRFKPSELGLSGVTVKFLGYGVFNDGLNEDDYSFLPLVNGVRIFPFHGNPQKNFLISLGLAPDLSDSSIIQCTLVMQPTDELVWQVSNKSAVSTAMGVRMKGYVDFTQIRTQQHFGG